MAQNEFHLSFAEDPGRASSHCASCGQAAEIHLLLLEQAPQRSGSFCLSCGEALMRDLLHQRATHGHAPVVGAEPARGAFLSNNIHHDDVEGGIIFWEGHGWSSDGPFAGA